MPTRGQRNVRWLSVTDRKSTRLNSSHEWISYAVFCLKKKKNKANNEGKQEKKKDNAETAQTSDERHARVEGRRGRLEDQTAAGEELSRAAKEPQQSQH